MGIFWNEINNSEKQKRRYQYLWIAHEVLMGATISRTQRFSNSRLHVTPSSPVFVIVVVCCLFFFWQDIPSGPEVLFSPWGQRKNLVPTVLSYPSLRNEREREPGNEVANGIAGHEATPPLVGKTR